MSRRSGQITKQGDRKWKVRIYRGTDPQTGRRVYESQTVKGTKKDAERELTELASKMHTGQLPMRSTLKLGEWCERWLEDFAAQKVRARTLNDYRYTFDTYVKPDPIWGLRLQQVKTAHLQALLRGLQKDPERSLGPRSIKLVHSVLAAALESARRQGLITMNPAPDVELPKQKRRDMRALSGEEVGRFLKAVESDRFAGYFVLALDTGARPNELLALRWDAVDFDAGSISILRTLPRLKKGEPLRFEDTKTERSRRKLRIAPETVRALAAHRARMAAERLAAKLGPMRPDDLVFTSVKGGPVDHQNLANRHFKPAITRAKLGKVRLYDLRHTTATALLMRCVPVNTVAARLGHASAKMTLDVYGHVLPETDEMVVSAISEAFFR